MTRGAKIIRVSQSDLLKLQQFMSKNIGSYSNVKGLTPEMLAEILTKATGIQVGKRQAKMLAKENGIKFDIDYTNNPMAIIYRRTDEMTAKIAEHETKLAELSQSIKALEMRLRNANIR